MKFNKNKLRYFLVAYTCTTGDGSLTFKCYCHPSQDWIYDAIITDNPKNIESSILNIHEFTKQDYLDFCKKTN